MLVKQDKLKELIQAIENIDLSTTETETLSKYMDATNILKVFTDGVKEEIRVRLESGTELTNYSLVTRKTLKFKDECEVIDELLAKEYSTNEIFNLKLKPVKDIILLTGKREADKLGIEETIKNHIRRKSNGKA